MKNYFKLLILVIGFCVYGAQEVKATGCTSCDGNASVECIRIISGNNVDIYYGKASACEQQ